MIGFARSNEAPGFIVGTETGILYPMSKAAPDKILVPADAHMVCPDMKKTHLEDVLQSLQTLSPEVRVPEHAAARARAAVQRMLDLKFRP